MEETIYRFLQHLFERLDGPFHFRMIVQPLVAMVFASIDGARDAREGNPAYVWALYKSAEHRRDMLKDGWKSFGKIFIVAIVLDILYQLIVFKWVYPAQALLVAFVLAILPYMLLRGPVNRILSLRK